MTAGINSEVRSSQYCVTVDWTIGVDGKGMESGRMITVRDVVVRA
jgi:hypothetical protein